MPKAPAANRRGRKKAEQTPVTEVTTATAVAIPEAAPTAVILEITTTAPESTVAPLVTVPEINLENTVTHPEVLPIAPVVPTTEITTTAPESTVAPLVTAVAEVPPTVPENTVTTVVTVPEINPIVPENLVAPVAIVPEIIKTPESPMSTASVPPTVVGTPVLPEVNVVNELGRVVKMTQDRIELIRQQREAATKRAEEQKLKIEAESHAEQERLNSEEQNLRVELQKIGISIPGAGREWPSKPTRQAHSNGTPAATTKPRGRPPGSKNGTPRAVSASGKPLGRPPGSKNGTPRAAAPAPKQRGGKRTGLSATNLVIGLVIDADGPVPMAEIREYLNKHGKGSNPSQTVSQLINRHILRKTDAGYVKGSQIPQMV
jgi:hypothetical protein